MSLNVGRLPPAGATPTIAALLGGACLFASCSVDREACQPLPPLPDDDSMLPAKRNTNNHVDMCKPLRAWSAGGTGAISELAASISLQPEMYSRSAEDCNTQHVALLFAMTVCNLFRFLVRHVTTMCPPRRRRAHIRRPFCKVLVHVYLLCPFLKLKQGRGAASTARVLQ